MTNTTDPWDHAEHAAGIAFIREIARTGIAVLTAAIVGFVLLGAEIILAVLGIATLRGVWLPLAVIALTALVAVLGFRAGRLAERHARGERLPPTNPLSPRRIARRVLGAPLPALAYLALASWWPVLVAAAAAALMWAAPTGLALAMRSPERRLEALQRFATPDDEP